MYIENNLEKDMPIPEAPLYDLYQLGFGGYKRA